MMWKEFEEIAGYEVSYEDYANVIEPMYMATELSKREFVKCLDEIHGERGLRCAGRRYA